MRYQQTNERRAVILMVVLSLLTLFAIVGITFVLYADAEAASARVARQAETQQRADVPAQQALSFFLSQLIYDVPDATGSGSGLRGHSLARTMYGYNSTGTNTTPFNGVGRLHTNGLTGQPTTTWPYMNLFNIDDYLLPNYTYFQGDGFARDPEWYTNVPSALPGTAKATGFYVGGNAPYTYPDLNNFYLAAVRSDGVVLTPSYHRPWLFQLNPSTGTPYINPVTNLPYLFNDPTNPNWSSAQGKYMTLRPRPAEHPLFPMPDDPTGDVKNLVGGPGGNDSIWIDAGAPVMTAPDGTLYKMLFAPLIMDLDNRINVGAAGNIAGGGALSRSNQGWFPSEVNLSTLWSTSANPTDWLKLYLGNGTSYGKYGTDQVPSSTLYPIGSPAHIYAQADLDGRNELLNGAATAPIFLPGTNVLAPATIPFPYFPQGYGSGSAAERIYISNTGKITYRHPAAYNAYKSPLYSTTTINSVYPPGSALAVNPIPDDDWVFRPSDMETLLRPNSLGANAVDSGSSALISYLTRLCPNSLGAGAAITQRRNWITTISNDLAKPGLSPWIYDPFNAASYAGAIAPSPLFPFAINAATPWLPPSGGTVAFPTFAQRQTQANNASPAGSDFTTDWRAAAAALGRLDLNQSLPPFPHMPTAPPTAMVTPNQRYDSLVNSGMAPNVLVQFTSAMQARQQFALNIYNTLLAVTGVALPSIPAGNATTDLPQRRWLAQLAVNIVDYIDDDEISTPFNFYDPGNPFGQPASPSGVPVVTGGPATPYQVDNTKNTLVTATANTLPANGFYDAGGLTGVAPYAPYYPVVGGNPDVPIYWVFGTELPRLVVNEVMAQYTLPTMPKTSPPQAMAGTFNVNVWVELFNPLPLAGPATTPGTIAATAAANGSTLQPLDALPVPLYQAVQGAAPAYNPYQIIIANNNNTSNTTQGLWTDQNPTPGINNNVLGTPLQLRYSTAPTAANPGGVPAICNFLTGAGTVPTVAAPATPSYSIGGPAGGLLGQSYMIVGPSATDMNNDITVPAGVPGATPILSSPNMTYPVTFTPAVGLQWSMMAPGNPVAVPISDNVLGTGISVLLRRLANPHLPPNPFTAAGTVTNPLLPPNPYITVDYVSGIQLNGYGLDQVKNQLVSVTTFAPIPATGAVPVNNNPPPVNNNPVQASYGKFQPYATNNLQFASQSTLKGGVGTVGLIDYHTLGLPNQPLATPFTWLVHLDRLLISPMELLHVSGFAPHLLTQRFITPNPTVINTADPDVVLQPYSYTIPTPLNAVNGQAPTGFNAGNYLCFQHYAPWFNQANRLYRLFEVLQTHDGASGTPGTNGRVPGKININTLWDPPLNMSANPPTTLYPLMYQAICDPSPTPNNPNFNATNVNTIFQTLLTLRTPGLASATLSQADRPFLGMAAGVSPLLPTPDPQYPAAYGFSDGNGINHTLFTNATPLPGTVPPPPGQWPPSPFVPALQLPNTAANNPQIAHPYLQNELLTKIYNNLTTRSNVFAVFVTVGFFEVTGTVAGSPNIPQLGPEIGRSEGRQIRHRMFAIVDRSQLPAFTGPLTTPYDPRNDPLVVPYFSIID